MRDRYERRHRRTARNYLAIETMANADFSEAPSLSEAMGLEDSMPVKVYGIWCNDTKDWLREMPSKVDDGGVAILAFLSEKDAKERAAKAHGYGTYSDAKDDGWCEVRRLSD